MNKTQVIDRRHKAGEIKAPYNAVESARCTLSAPNSPNHLPVMTLSGGNGRVFFDIQNTFERMDDTPEMAALCLLGWGVNELDAGVFGAGLSMYRSHPDLERMVIGFILDMVAHTDVGLRGFYSPLPQHYFS